MIGRDGLILTSTIWMLHFVTCGRGPARQTERRFGVYSLPVLVSSRVGEFGSHFNFHFHSVESIAELDILND
jgi:hypothetical protein